MVSRLFFLRPTALGLSAAWVLLFVIAAAGGLLDPVENALGDAVHRAFDATPPSGRVWLAVIDDETLRRLAPADDRDLWRRLVDRAIQDRVDRLVVIDPPDIRALGEVLRERDPAPLKVIVPTRLRFDPYFETAAGVERPFAEPEVPPGRYTEALLHLEPDADGTWRHAPLYELVRGQRVPAIAAVLADGDLPDAQKVKIAFNGPGADALPSVSGWRMVTGDLGEPPWRNGVLIVARGDSGYAADIWTPYGRQISEARAVAQMAESLGTARWYSFAPLWAAGLVFFLLFHLCMGASTGLRPLRGLAAAALLTFGLSGAIGALRLFALWTFPVAPILPTAVVGFLVGLNFRHQLLQGGMSNLAVELGRSRLLNAISRKTSSDEGVVARLLELLGIDRAAVIDAGRQDPIIAATAREFPAAFFERFRQQVPSILERIARSDAVPMIFRAGADDPGYAITRIAAGPARSFYLVLGPREHAETWWQNHRELVNRLCIPLATHLAEKDQPSLPAEDRPQPPEGQLAELHGSVAKSESERTFLLKFIEEMPGGVLVCDLLGRVLLFNRTFERMANLLGASHENLLLALLQQATGQSEPAVWKQVSQVIRSRTPLQLQAAVDKGEVHTLLLNLGLLDLGTGTSRGAPMEVLALAVTDVSSVAPEKSAEPARMKEMATMFRDTYSVLSQILDALQKLLAPEQAFDSGIKGLFEESLEGIRMKMDRLRSPLLAMTQHLGTQPSVIAEAEPIDLVAEAERAISDALPIAAELGLSLKRLGEDVVPMAYARPEPLRRALSIAIEQSLASSPQGGVVTVSAHAGGEDVEIQVSNSGWGADQALPPTQDSKGAPAGRSIPPHEMLSRAVSESGGRIDVILAESGGTIVRLFFTKVS